MLNLFILPSWYPNPFATLSGVFVRDQVEAIADLATDVRVLVSTWGHNSSELSGPSLRKPFDALRWYRNHRSCPDISERSGLYELFCPTLTWTVRLPLGGMRRLLASNRRNLENANRRFGSIDLIHAHVSFPGGFLASQLSQEFAIPYVLTEHMGPFPFPALMQRGRPRKEIDMAFARASASIAVSPASASRIASFGYPLPTVIPNAVDERRFHPGDSHGDKCVFFTLCSLCDSKGVGDLLQAIAKWNPPSDRYEFRIGGDGPQRRRYESLARTLGINDRVRWLGEISRDEAPRWFQECHIFVLPSRHEAFGMVYAEALASGKPVIATRCGGPDSIVNDANGVLVEVGDIVALAESMAWMSHHHATYSSQAIREDFMKRFSRRAVVDQLVTLYGKVLGTRAPPTPAAQRFSAPPSGGNAVGQ
jgi:glycosyltransferase involved in cell wall biosynthesis